MNSYFISFFKLALRMLSFIWPVLFAAEATQKGEEENAALEKQKKEQQEKEQKELEAKKSAAEAQAKCG